MTAYKHTPCAKSFAPPPRDLRKILDSVSTDALLKTLDAPRRGPRGHSQTALWRAHIAAYYLNLPHTTNLIRELRKDPELRAICGFGDEIPHRTTFSRFNAKLTRCLNIVEGETRALTRVFKAELPRFGEKIAVDSTNVYVHSNPDRAPDAEAGWTAKTISNARPDKTDKRDWHFGYKLHCAIDAVYGIPITSFTTAANVSDTLTMPRLVDEVASECSPQAVIADKGYDSQSNHDAIIARGAHPIIPMRAKRSKTEIAGDLHTADGVLKCIGDVPMTRVDYDERKGWLYRCRAEECRLKTRKGVRYCDDEVWDKPIVSRQYPAIPRSSEQWKSLYNLRQSVERFFKTLKQSRRLNSHCQRGLARIALHCALSVLAFQMTALSTIRSGRPDLLRWMVEPVP